MLTFALLISVLANLVFAGYVIRTHTISMSLIRSDEWLIGSQTNQGLVLDSHDDRIGDLEARVAAKTKRAKPAGRRKTTHSEADTEVIA